ncbi:MAG: GtrA family protein [Candidatus Margulisbacteria bacterium]|nr:GtrA family protein [Candidatus Margulisiibacteriota bacterium]
MIIKTIKNILEVRFIRFLLTGVLCAIFGYSVYALFIILGVHYTIASFCSTFIGILFNFKVYGKLVFNSKNNKLIFRFFLSYGISYIINIGLLAIFNIFHINMLVAGAILLFPMGIISYLLQKNIVYIDSNKI